MRKFCAALSIALVTAASAHADDRPLSQEEIEGVQNAIEAMGCTVAVSEIEAEGSGFEADDVICGGVQYDVYLDKDFKVVKKVKED